MFIHVWLGVLTIYTSPGSLRVRETDTTFLYRMKCEEWRSTFITSYNEFLVLCSQVFVIYHIANFYILHYSESCIHTCMHVKSIHSTFYNTCTLPHRTSLPQCKLPLTVCSAPRHATCTAADDIAQSQFISQLLSIAIHNTTMGCNLYQVSMSAVHFGVVYVTR